MTYYEGITDCCDAKYWKSQTETLQFLTYFCFYLFFEKKNDRQVIYDELKLDINTIR